MDFFERQDKARKKTKLLVIYFACGVGLLTTVLYFAVLGIFTISSAGHRAAEVASGESVMRIGWWNWQIFLGVTFGTLAVVALGSLYKTLQLRQGGAVVASMLGGRLINPATTDSDERKVLNVVEEMAIASGVPVPQVFLLPEEQGINAFAAGHGTSDATITVTQGTLKMLTRDELQGVIGHEFSHILNGDMQLNLRLMGLIFGIMCVAIIGRVLLSTRGRSQRDRNALPLLGVVLLIAGWMGVFFGRLIQAAVSRQREFLADASAIQFTRNPAGLSGALQKIGRYSFGSHIQSPKAEQASHMYFSNGISEPLMGLLATHPPISERIRVIDPSWDGKFPPLPKEQLEVVQQAAFAELERHRNAPSFMETMLGEEAISQLVEPELRPPPRRREEPQTKFPAPPIITAQTFFGNLGNPTPAHLSYAEKLRDAITPELRTEVQNALGAATLVYGTLLSDQETTRTRQLQELAKITSDEICQETLRLLPAIQTVATQARLPLIDMALPGLRQMSPQQFDQFRDAVKALVESDGEIDLFEYMLQKVVLRHLEPHYVAARKPPIQYYALKPLVNDCAVLLSALANVGARDEAQKKTAFENGAQLLRYYAQADFRLLTDAECELVAVDRALNRLAQAVPQIKKNVLSACSHVVAADGVIQHMEAELLRAIADTLDCPIPPIIECQITSPDS